MYRIINTYIKLVCNKSRKKPTKNKKQILDSEKKRKTICTRNVVIKLRTVCPRKNHGKEAVRTKIYYILICCRCQMLPPVITRRTFTCVCVCTREDYHSCKVFLFRIPSCIQRWSYWLWKNVVFFLFIFFFCVHFFWYK